MMQESPSRPTAESAVLFEDAMNANWQEHWFLDGKKAVVEHRDGGLYFSAGTVTKRQDRNAYHAHHAVLWTKQEFQGDIRISVDCKKVDASNYGNVLIYVQAQGIGQSPYVKDIHAWRQLREIPAMSNYFNYMNLLSISLRNELRCKLYPWNDMETGAKFAPLIEPMADWPGMERNTWYRIEVDKRLRSLTFRLYDGQTRDLLTDVTWDIGQKQKQRPGFTDYIHKGRIGLRHMSTKQCVYRNFKVSRIESSAATP